MFYLDCIVFDKVVNDTSFTVIEGESSPGFSVNGTAVSGEAVGYVLNTQMASGSASGGAVLSVEPQSAVRPLEITYTVNIDAAGEYNVTLDRSVADNSYAAAGKLSIGGRTISLYDNNTPEEISRVDCGGFTVPIYRYRLEDTVTLSSGENAVTVILDELPEGRAGIDDKAVFYLDCIVFEKKLSDADFSLSLEDETIGEGECTRARITDSSGNVMSPKLLGAHFTSSNIAAAIVEQDGWVTGENRGRAEICAEFEYEGRKYTLKKPVTVEESTYGIIINSVKNTDAGVELVYTAVGSSAAEDYVAICAGYANERFVESDVRHIKMPPKWVCATIQFDLNSQDDERWLYLWHNIEDLMPVAEKIEIK